MKIIYKVVEPKPYLDIDQQRVSACLGYFEDYDDAYKVAKDRADEINANGGRPNYGGCANINIEDIYVYDKGEKDGGGMISAISEDMLDEFDTIMERTRKLDAYLDSNYTASELFRMMSDYTYVDNFMQYILEGTEWDIDEVGEE